MSNTSIKNKSNYKIADKTITPSQQHHTISTTDKDTTKFNNGTDNDKEISNNKQNNNKTKQT